MGFEDLFEKAFDEEAARRGFLVADNMGSPVLGATPYYKNSDWVIVAHMTTMFPETTVRINFTPRNPPPATSLQHLLKCEAIWLDDQEKWSLQEREYTTKELISFAFDQMQNQSAAL